MRSIGLPLRAPFILKSNSENRIKIHLAPFCGHVGAEEKSWINHSTFVHEVPNELKNLSWEKLNNGS